MPVRTYFVYIMASQKNGTLYIGMTNDLVRRVYEHKNDAHEGFTQKYGVHRLVYYESTNDVTAAITREKRMKKWKRQWKINLIEERNPDWKDLSEGFSIAMDPCLRRGDRSPTRGDMRHDCHSCEGRNPFC
ncbi:MAG: GIY-YIG nuclease family protein [Caldilineaceae bacterium]|nr:GIY-YIG nuclease family protein [Caldilineaceae bacterium]